VKKQPKRKQDARAGRKPDPGEASRKTLSDMRRESDEQRTDPAEAEEPDGDGWDSTETRRKTLRATPTALIVGAAFEAAVSPKLRRRLTHGQALAAIVVVPSAAWVAPATAWVKTAYGSRWCMQVRDGTDRKRDSTFGNDDVARDLSKGLCVMGVAVEENALPAVLQSAADVVIRIAPPDGTVLRKAITRFARRSPGELDRGLGAGLDLAQMVAAFRPGTGAGGIVRRLDAARGSIAGPAERVPDLETAIEYGEARIWALNLAKDVAQFKDSRSKPDFDRLDRGILLWSRTPGLGKSTFCKSVALKCGAPLVSTSAGEWFSHGQGYLHTIVQRFRAEVAKARSLANPIAFLAIEEVDAAVPNRATLSDHAREWHNILIADILATLDSTMAAGSRLILLASSNEVGRIDPAMLRPGRLEKAVEIPLPDSAGALNILKFHLNGELEADLSFLGPLLAGRTGADIMYLVRGARRAARHADRALAVDDLRRAALPTEAHPPARLRRMAVHEAAHAVVALAIRAGTIDRVVLRADGAAGGRTVVNYSDDDLTTRATVEDRVTVALAARAAELAFTGSMSTGSGGAEDSDLGFATLTIAGLHVSYGLCADAPLYLGAGPGELLQALALDGSLRARVADDLRRLEARAASLVEANRAAIDAVAARLASRRHLDGAEVEGLVRGLLVADPGPGSRPAATGRRPKTNP
jgi:hypothetical protein